MNRKHGILPENLDAEQLGTIAQYIRKHRGDAERPQARQVEQILELLSKPRAGLRSLEKAQILARLTRLLGRYRWSVRVSPATEGFTIFHYPADRPLSADEKFGYDAVQMLLSIAPFPLLSERPRIRRCANENCREWVFAVKTNKKIFCGDNCKQAVYDSKPENREQKRLNAKKSREIESEKAKRAIGFRAKR